MTFSLPEYEKLKAIHADVFSMFSYKTDKHKWKLPEYWEGTTLAEALAGHKFTGDCEEFAMAAMKLVTDAGMSARLVICYTELDEGHCLCEVGSRDLTKSYFLDNRRNGVVSLSSLKGYKFHSVSPWNPVPGETRQWHRVSVQS